MMRLGLLVLAVVLAAISVWHLLKVFEVIEKGPPEGVGSGLSLIVVLIIVLQAQKKDRPA
jgi:hypothetical protein